MKKQQWRVEVTPMEIIAEPICFYQTNGEKQIILRILKRKGAPVFGFFTLIPNLVDYEWETEINILTGNRKFFWTEK